MIIRRLCLTGIGISLIHCGKNKIKKGEQSHELMYQSDYSTPVNKNVIFSCCLYAFALQICTFSATWHVCINHSYQHTILNSLHIFINATSIAY